MPVMRRFSLLALALLGCSDGDPNSHSTFLSGSAGSADGTDEVGSSDSGESSSASETNNSESGSTFETSESESSSTSSDTATSSETGEPECLRQRYTFNLGTETWSAIPIEQDWTGANAPPCSIGVLAVTYIGGWSELLVIGDDQTTYRRVDGIWQPPLGWSDSFAALVGTQPTALLHTPSTTDPSEVTLYFLVSGGQAVLYTYGDNGGAVLADVVDVMDGPPPAPPQASEDLRWAFELADVSLVPDPDWLVWFMNYTDGFLYRFNAAFEWVQQPQGNNTYFGTGQANEPDPSQIEAAYADIELGRVYFVGP